MHGAASTCSYTATSRGNTQLNLGYNFRDEQLTVTVLLIWFLVWFKRSVIFFCGFLDSFSLQEIPH